MAIREDGEEAQPQAKYPLDLGLQCATPPRLFAVYFARRSAMNTKHRAAPAVFGAPALLLMLA